MKVRSKFLQRLHLDPRHGLLSGRNVHLLREFFAVLNVRQKTPEAIDDVQFLAFMRQCTDLRESEIYRVFDLFDWDDSGLIEFDEFYLMICMLVAIKDGHEKQFLFRHSRTCFDLLDEDGSKQISLDEFMTFGFLFGFDPTRIRLIFKEFDVTGDSELDYQEFRMFTFACIDLMKDNKNVKGLKRITSGCCPC